MIEIKYKANKNEYPKKDDMIKGQALQDRSMCFGVSKDSASLIKIGDEITVTVSGKVTRMGEPFDYSVPGMKGSNTSQKMVEVELQTPKVMEVTSNSADVELRRMTGD